jgi:periplasmic protein TonB
MSRVYMPPDPKRARPVGVVVGLAVSILIFLAIPLTQIFNDYSKSPEEILGIDLAPPPPPPPLEDPPPPPEPEPEKTPPEIERPPPSISLEELEIALEPGTSVAMQSDFALPSLTVNSDELGGLDIFDINDLDKKPRSIKQIAPMYPMDATRRGLSGYAQALFVIDQRGNVISVKITSASDPIFEKPTIDAIRQWKFTPGEKGGKPVVTRAETRIPYQIQN